MSDKDNSIFSLKSIFIKMYTSYKPSTEVNYSTEQQAWGYFFSVDLKTFTSSLKILTLYG